MSINFRLVSEFQTIQRRSFELGTPAVLNPNSVSPVPLVDGEFLELTAAYKMDRGSANPAVVPSYCYFAEQGRYETQAIQKGPFLFGGTYEADTLIMDATALTLGAALEATDVTIATLTRRGLKLATSGLVLGYVTRLPANNKGFLRFQSSFA